VEHFVTLFDCAFLPQGIALIRSMERHLNSYVLWILCVDDQTFNVLERINFKNVRLLKLSNLENDKLKKVKSERTKGEYCWTLTPFSLDFVFAADRQVKRVTYLDADMWFRKNPSAIFDEYQESGKSVLITDHNYAAENDQSAISGQFCVQFMIFDRDGSCEIRNWWAEKCIDWCYARVEDGKFGDQKYLDIWPALFPNLIHILQGKEFLLAPWNASRFPYGNSICWHFHGLRIYRKKSSWNAYIGVYKLPKTTLQNVYKPYLDDLKWAIKVLKESNWDAVQQIELSPFMKIYLRAKFFLRFLEFTNPFYKL
jgi:hypothetical protein